MTNRPGWPASRQISEQMPAASCQSSSGPASTIRPSSGARSRRVCRRSSATLLARIVRRDAIDPWAAGGKAIEALTAKAAAFSRRCSRSPGPRGEGGCRSRPRPGRRRRPRPARLARRPSDVRPDLRGPGRRRSGRGSRACAVGGSWSWGQVVRRRGERSRSTSQTCCANDPPGVGRGGAGAHPVGLRRRRAGHRAEQLPGSVGPSNPSPTPPPLIPSSPPAPVGPTTSAVVTRVADGQTIEVALDGRTAIVRYIGIAIPVSAGPTSSAPNIVQQATAANSGLVARQTVILEQDVSDLDASGRLLRYVWVQNGGRLTLVNLALVSLGLARVASSPPDIRYDELLRAAESEARDAQRGLWAAGASGMTASPVASGPDAASTPGASSPSASPEGAGSGSPSSGATNPATPTDGSPSATDAAPTESPLNPTASP